MVKPMGIIFLTGPKHSGKTSAGRALANLCSAQFTDLDEAIEQRTGRSPRDLYREGPEIFRKAEAETLAALIAGPESALRIIAGGGGIIDNREALVLLEKLKTIKRVYLDVPAETAWKRINAAGKGELPPFLQTENPKETHRALHERRALAYRSFAEITIEAGEKSSEEIAREILELSKN
jgi:shikimate kinase